MNNRKLTITLIALSSLVLIFASTAFAGPKITKVELSQPVNDGYYVVALDTSNPYTMVGLTSAKLNGIWVKPGEPEEPGGAIFGDESTTIDSSMANVSVAAMLNAGDKSVYPALLLSLPTDSTQMKNELLTLIQNSNPVISANEDIAKIPTNIDTVDLDRAIPAGTEVTFTVDMDGELFHALAVTGGTAPEVTYDATGNGTLTLKTTTFATTNAAGQTLNSIVGFLIVTNSQGGTEPLRIIIQTNNWGGDIVEIPSLTDDTIGTVETMCGITAYGPDGESRDVYFFFPDMAIGPVFGSSSGFQPSNLAMFLDSAQQDSAALEYGVTKLGVPGTEATASYTFAAPAGRAKRSDTKMDVTLGIKQSDEDVCVLNDLDGDEKAGLAEVIHILKNLTTPETPEETR